MSETIIEFSSDSTLGFLSKSALGFPMESRIEDLGQKDSVARSFSRDFSLYYANHIYLYSPRDFYLYSPRDFSWNSLKDDSRYDKIKQRISEVREEVEEFYKSDNKIIRIPEKAYDGAENILNSLLVRNTLIPMPEIDCEEDGSVSLTWFPEGGTVDVSIYEDGIVIYAVYFHEKRQVEGVFELSDSLMTFPFLNMLSNILPK